MKILATVLARGGSKRVPGKNLREIDGKPLVTRAVDGAMGLADVCAVLVSTDDSHIAQVATAAGALVPWLRPAHLASDTASSVDACLHALDWFEREFGTIDGLMLLQPTSPFRTRESVLTGIDLFRSSGLRSVIGVSPAKSHPFWCFRVEEGWLRPYFPGADLTARSQDLPPAYVINGAFYLITPTRLRRDRTFMSADMLPIMMSEKEGLDVDSEEDWALAQSMASRQELAT
jgi:N-acylneuraminate cytidylyltransferase